MQYEIGVDIVYEFDSTKYNFLFYRKISGNCILSISVASEEIYLISKLFVDTLILVAMKEGSKKFCAILMATPAEI